ncbi:hypothetical protein AB0M47_00390 [Hamadaea sp. NPDC051192]|uniref:hypothetical protein n=1 Tax=Hamadaea sp. NPDC051192 TaxID=3154940 RepID=UPI003422A84B
MGKPAVPRAVLVCAGLLGVLASAAYGGAPREQTTMAVTAPPRLGDIRPPASAIPLPSDRAAGDGIAVYRPGRTKGPVYLLTSTGTQYALPVLGDTAPPSPVPSPGASAVEPLPPDAYEVDPMFGVSLSPDGRYLARPVYPRLTEIRDLRGTAVLRLATGELPQAWSADGSRLIVRVADGGFKEHYVAVEIRTGGRTTLTACAGLEVGPMLAEGLVLCVPPPGTWRTGSCRAWREWPISGSRPSTARYAESSTSTCATGSRNAASRCGSRT